MIFHIFFHEVLQVDESNLYSRHVCFSYHDSSKVNNQFGYESVHQTKFLPQHLQLRKTLELGHVLDWDGTESVMVFPIGTNVFPTCSCYNFPKAETATLSG
jgi:hypothetical protein